MVEHMDCRGEEATLISSGDASFIFGLLSGEEYWRMKDVFECEKIKDSTLFKRFYGCPNI
jgi:hypothetical protein